MKKWLAIAPLLLILGCATTGEKMPLLKEGMTKADVINIFGNPDGFQRSGDYEALHYNHRLVTGWAWDRADYNVILKDGKVIEYGQGAVRVKEGPQSVLVLSPIK